jgi:dihydrofolate reductase
VRIVLSDFMSLDGIVQSPGGQGEDTDGGFAHGGWSMPYFEPETMGPAVAEVMAGTEALLFGRRTWQTMAAAWPSRAGDPFADRMNEIPKYVASRTLTQDDLTWPGSTLLPASLTATTPMDRACRNDLVARGTIDMLWSRSPAAHGPHSRGPGDIDAKDGA